MLLFVILFVAYLIYYLTYTHIPTEIYFNYDKSRVAQIIQRCPNLKLYSPSFFFVNNHLQTIIARLLRLAPPVLYVRDIVPSHDATEITLDWVDHTFETAENTPILLLLHGLVGSSASSYVRSTVSYISKAKGWKVVVLTSRGCGNTRLKTPKTHHAGFTSDVKQAVTYIRNKYPKAPIVAGAYSLGANVLTKYLGEEGSNAMIAGAISICNPFDFQKISKYSHTTLITKFYNRVLARSLTKYFERNKAIFKGVLDIEHVLSSTYIEEFDERVVCKLFGYETYNEYYQKESCGQYMDKIAIPMLFLNSADDPVLMRTFIPKEKVYSNDNIAFAITERGGHVAFLQGIKYWQPSWSDIVIGEFLEGVLKTSKTENALQVK